jgi:DNA polymerase
LRIDQPTLSAVDGGVIDPAEAFDALLEELRRRKAEGERFVTVSDESVRLLRSLAGDHSAVAAPAQRSPARDAAPERPGSFTRPERPKPAAAAQPAAPARPVAAAASAPGGEIPDPPKFELPEGSREQRLEWIRRRILECPETARHLRPGMKPVLGVGPADAPVVLVGEAPTLEEAESGVPFAGDSGALLRKILSAAGLTEKDVFLLPVMGWRPESASEFIKRPPNARELAFNRPYLLAQIQAVAPRAVMAFGAHAHESLLGIRQPVQKVRGTWHEVAGLPVLLSFHPNYLLHTPSESAKRTVWTDFLALLEKLGRPVTEKQRAYFLPRGA